MFPPVSHCLFVFMSVCQCIRHGWMPEAWIGRCSWIWVGSCLAVGDGNQTGVLWKCSSSSYILLNILWQTSFLELRCKVCIIVSFTFNMYLYCWVIVIITMWLFPFLKNICVCVYVNVYHICIGSCMGQKRTLSHMEVGLCCDGPLYGYRAVNLGLALLP